MRGRDGVLRRRRALLATVAALAVAMPKALAQTPVSEAGSELTVSVITLGQGDQVWERYGHNALWIHDAARGTDWTYNWGVFDASSASFIIRFVRGRMRYWLEDVDVERLLAFYRMSDRTITIQRLALSPAQRVALRDFAQWNAREENKYYWYDYFRDNCSTRLRDAVDRALGGALRRATDSVTTTNTYRSESIRLMAGMPLTQAGIAIGLGPLADRRLSAWEEMFIPMRMRDRLRAITVRGPDGVLIPLVADEEQVYVASRPPELQRAPPLLMRYLLIGTAAAVLIIALGFVAQARASAPFAVVAMTWTLLSGIMGLVLLFLWLGTHHLFAYRNENMLHFNPLAVVLAAVIPAALYRRRATARAWRIAAGIVAVSMAGVVLKALPGFNQANYFAIALVLPGHVALAWTFLRLARAAATRVPVS